MTKDDAMMAGEDDLARADELGLAMAPGGIEGGEEDDPETFDVELDGEVHTLPAALKGGFLRQADYTRKTQELAEHRRAIEAERQTLTHERRAVRGASGDRATLHALEEQLEAFEGVDWRALQAEEPQRARALWASYQETHELRERFAYVLSHHDAREDLRTAREAADEMAATGQALRGEIEGWSPDVAAKLIEYGQAFGVTLEEFAQMADPRLWKLLHKAWRADQTHAGESEAEARAVRPAVTVSGGGVSAGGVRDELGTKEWMRRRNAQMTGGR